jgi:hypothetical protein
MTNKQFIKIAVLVTAFLCVCATGLALLRVRAQTATIQPFTAVMLEEVLPREDQPPTPLTRVETIAVRSDGSITRVSRMDVRLPVKYLFSRDVIDATNQVRVAVEDYTRTMVKQDYSDLLILKPGVVCEGNPSGKVEGFDVLYSEHAMAPDGGVAVTHKQWLAPQLGCYPLIQEWVGTVRGRALDTKQTLVDIKLGEPDPWYFNVPTNYTTKSVDESIALFKPLLKQ